MSHDDDQVPLWAVLTGDLIGSSRAADGALDRAMAALSATVREIGAWHAGPAPTLNLYRGDGWQCALPDPVLALRAALVLQARLRAAKDLPATRISIGIGQIDRIDRADPGRSSGPAFVLSGHGLDSMPRSETLAIAGTRIAARDQIIATLMAEIASGWSRPQAEAAALALTPAAALGGPTLADMAQHLGISPQAVSYRLAGGGIRAMRDSLTRWEGLLQRTLAQTGDAG